MDEGGADHDDDTYYTGDDEYGSTVQMPAGPTP
jgi:hypothetical protein